MKARLYGLKRKKTIEERTFEDKEAMIEKWIELVDVENQIHELLADYEKGMTVHPRIPLQLRVARQDHFCEFQELVLDELHKDFTYVSQLKFQDPPPDYLGP